MEPTARFTSPAIRVRLTVAPARSMAAVEERRASAALVWVDMEKIVVAEILRVRDRGIDAVDKEPVAGNIVEARGTAAHEVVDVQSAVHHRARQIDTARDAYGVACRGAVKPGAGRDNAVDRAVADAAANAFLTDNGAAGEIEHIVARGAVLAQTGPDFNFEVAARDIDDIIARRAGGGEAGGQFPDDVAVLHIDDVSGRIPHSGEAAVQPESGVVGTAFYVAAFDGQNVFRNIARVGIAAGQERRAFAVCHGADVGVCHADDIGGDIALRAVSPGDKAMHFPAGDVHHVLPHLAGFGKAAQDPQFHHSEHFIARKTAINLAAGNVDHIFFHQAAVAHAANKGSIADTVDVEFVKGGIGKVHFVMADRAPGFTQGCGGVRAVLKDTILQHVTDGSTSYVQRVVFDRPVFLTARDKDERGISAGHIHRIV